jgi:hypothetical protein
MTQAGDLALRAFYVLAGLGFIVYALIESTSRMILYIPILLGILLVVQGVSGA